MYLEADIKVTKMYRKGEMRRKKCKERERERGGGGVGWGVSGMTETQTVKEEESKKEERNSNKKVRKLLGQLRGTLPVCKNQLIKAALMTYNC